MILSSPDPAADPYFAAALLALQLDAFEIEAGFMGTRDLPPLHDDHDSLAAFRGTWVTAWDGTFLAGAIAWRDRGDVVEIEKVMVHPTAHRRGIGSALMSALIDSAAGRPITVTTGRDNPPGLAMYAKHGFEPVGDEHVPPGIWLTRMTRPSR